MSDSITHLLDTHICSYLMRKKPPAVVERLRTVGPARVAVSVVTALEFSRVQGLKLENWIPAGRGARQ